MEQDRRLQNLLLRVNKEYFRFSTLPLIKMSRGKTVLSKYQKSVVFGSYSIHKNRISIHPILLGDTIPEFVLEFVIYHEMLHYQDRVWLVKRPRRSMIHCPDFRKRERQFLMSEESKYFLKSLVNRTR